MPTVSIVKGAGSLSHNLRKNSKRSKSEKSWDPDKTASNKIFISEDIREVYSELFDESLQGYNSKCRKGRMIDDYYEHVKRSQQLKPFYEFVFSVGNVETIPKGSKEEALAKECLTEYVNTFQERNPNFRVFQAVMHNDEKGVPHVHLDMIPFSTGNKRGLSTQNSFSGALKDMGFKKGSDFEVWRERELDTFKDILERHGLVFELGEGRQEHMNVSLYKETMKQKETNSREKEDLETKKEDLQKKEDSLNALEGHLKSVESDLNKREQLVYEKENFVQDARKQLIDEKASLSMLKDLDCEVKDQDFSTEVAINSTIMVQYDFRRELPKEEFEEIDYSGVRVPMYKVEKKGLDKFLTKIATRICTAESKFKAAQNYITNFMNPDPNSLLAKRVELEKLEAEISLRKLELESEKEGFEARIKRLEEENKCFKENAQKYYDQGYADGANEQMTLKRTLKRVVLFIAQKAPQVMKQLREKFEHGSGVKEDEKSMFNRCYKAVERDLEKIEEKAREKERLEEKATKDPLSRYYRKYPESQKPQENEYTNTNSFSHYYVKYPSPQKSQEDELSL